MPYRLEVLSASESLLAGDVFDGMNHRSKHQSVCLRESTLLKTQASLCALSLCRREFPSRPIQVSSTPSAPRVQLFNQRPCSSPAQKQNHALRSKTQSFSHSSVSSAGNYKHSVMVVAKHDAERLVVAFYGARSGLISATSRN